MGLKYQMVVCDSADQARKLFEIFVSKYNPDQKIFESVEPYSIAAEPSIEFDNYKKDQKKIITSSIILHDIGTKEERKQQVDDFKDGNNAELFSKQISQIEDRNKILEIKKALEMAKNLYNIIRLSGQYELLDKIDFKKLNELYGEASRHLDLLNLKESLQNNPDSTNLLNVALENILFMFRKISEEEMIIADQLKDMLRKTREALGGNFDQNDPEFVSLYDELKRLFDKKNLDEITQENMKNNIGSLQVIFDKVTELNRRNDLLKAKYEYDAKYARLHKRILENGKISNKVSEIGETLLDIKKHTDEKVLINTKLLDNESFFNSLVLQMVIKSFNKTKITLQPESARYINNCLVKEVMNEYQGTQKW